MTKKSMRQRKKKNYILDMYLQNNKKQHSVYMTWTAVRLPSWLNLQISKE